MNIDNYSKAIGIVYATSHMMHPMDEPLDAVALRMYNEALSLLTSADVPQKVEVPKVNWIPLNAVPVPVEAPQVEPVKEEPEVLPDKTACNSKWRIGEDSFIRCSASGKEATKNKPLDCTKTNTQVLSRWHYMSQKGMLLSKNSQVIYAGGNIELSGKFKGVTGKVSAFTDDKKKAIVYFGTDASAYEIPICDLMGVATVKVGEA